MVCVCVCVCVCIEKVGREGEGLNDAIKITTTITGIEISPDV